MTTKIYLYIKLQLNSYQGCLYKLLKESQHTYILMHVHVILRFSFFCNLDAALNNPVTLLFGYLQDWYYVGNA